MHCPYCTSVISDNAIACPHCTRDLYLFKPLLEKIEALEARIVELEKAHAHDFQVVPDDHRESAPLLPQHVSFAVFLTYWLLPLLLLLLAHFSITVIFDLKTVFLRIASLLIPLCFGYLLMRQRFSLLAWSMAAIALGLSAAWSMSAVIAQVDGIPILPQDIREWREFIEYAASMGLAYVTGMILGAHLRDRREHAQRQSSELMIKIAKLINSGNQSADKLSTTISKLRELNNSLTIAATSAAAAYAGLKNLIVD